MTWVECGLQKTFQSGEEPNDNLCQLPMIVKEIHQHLPRITDPCTKEETLTAVCNFTSKQMNAVVDCLLDSSLECEELRLRGMPVSSFPVGKWFLGRGQKICCEIIVTDVLFQFRSVSKEVIEEELLGPFSSKNLHQALDTTTCMSMGRYISSLPTACQCPTYSWQGAASLAHSSNRSWLL